MPAVIEGVGENDSTPRASNVTAPVAGSTDWISASIYDGIVPR